MNMDESGVRMMTNQNSIMHDDSLFEEANMGRNGQTIDHGGVTESRAAPFVPPA